MSRNWLIVAVSFAAALIVGPGLAQTPQQPLTHASVITNPSWDVRPSSKEIDDYFPITPSVRGIGGDTVISCAVTAVGLLRDCLTVTEMPENMGFGEAEIALASRFKMNPQLKDGVQQDGAKINIPMHWAAGGPGYQPPPPRTQVFKNVQWYRTPTFTQWSAAFPDKAKNPALDGLATLRCEVDGRGELKTCHIQSEIPNSKGFGAAALSLAPYFRAPWMAAKGIRDGEFVEFNIAFPKDLATGKAPRLSAPEVVSLPSSQQFGSFFPQAAKARHFTSGEVTLDCMRDDVGFARHCDVISEGPAGVGFGEAAVAISPTIKFSLWTVNGRPTSDRARLPVAFEAARP